MRDYPDLNLTITWLPSSRKLVGFRRAKQTALEAIRVANLEEIEEPHTTKKQKATAKQQAYQGWAEQWHQAPRTSLVYRTALTKPPDGRLHPAFKAPPEANWRSCPSK